MTGSSHESLGRRMLVDGVEYRLPQRNLGPLRAVGAIFLIVALFLTSIAGAMSIAAIRVLVFKAPMQGSPPTWPMLAFLLVMLLVTLALCGGALGFFFGRTIVRLRGTHLTTINTFGPYRWKRRAEIADITSLTVSRGETRRNGKVITTGPLADLSVLVAELKNKRKPMFVAIGYPSDVLHALGKAIGDGHGIEAHTAQGRRGRRARASGEPLEQPKDSRVIVTRTDGQLTLTIPPPGLHTGSRGLFSFSLFWMTLCVGLSIGLGIAIANGTPWKTASSGLWIFALVTGCFWITAVGLLLGSIHMGRNRAIIDVLNGKTVMINRQSILGLKQNQWEQDDIKRIKVGYSSLTVNNRLIQQLQFSVWPPGEPRRRVKEFSMFTGRDDDELEWIVDMLNHELGRD